MQTVNLGRVVGQTNKNILHNWDFRKPVNRRAAASYPNSGYAIDRWALWYCAMAINAGTGITLTGSAASGALVQIVADYAPYKGKTVTASIKVLGGTGFAQGAFLSVYDGISYTYADITVAGLTSVTKTVSGSASELRVNIATQSGAGSYTLQVESVKLEIGAASTLANDPPADYAEQMLLCQSISDDGSAYQRGFGSNPNLLHNWDFRNPVNQRAASSYTATSSSTAVFTIDRWKMNSNDNGQDSTFTVADGYITIASATSRPVLRQFTEITTKEETVLTLSLYVTAITGGASMYIRDTSYATYGLLSTIAAPGMHTITRIVPAGKTLMVQINTNTIGDSVSINKVKLELGSASTLANDTLADYAEQLALCQRFFLRLGSANYGVIGYGVGSTTANKVNLYINTPVPMRITPTAALSAGHTIKAVTGATTIAITGAALSAYTPPTYGMVTLVLDAIGEVAGTFYVIQATGGSGGFLELSADL